MIEYPYLPILSGNYFAHLDVGALIIHLCKLLDSAAIRAFSERKLAAGPRQ
jgi:hypothetical protein